MWVNTTISNRVKPIEKEMQRKKKKILRKFDLKFALNYMLDTQLSKPLSFSTQKNLLCDSIRNAPVMFVMA